MLRHELLLALAVSAVAGATPESDSTSVRFKEERLVIEYTASAGEAALVMSAESEVPLGRVALSDPRGGIALRLQAGTGRNLSLSGFKVESRESTLDELLAAYPPGRYGFGGCTAQGDAIFGSANLVHDLPRPARILWPVEGATDVSTEDLVVRWEGDPSATGFHVILEQGDNDGIAIQVPPGTDSLAIPGGILESGTETLLEIATIAAGGNRTLFEVKFTTR